MLHLLARQRQAKEALPWLPLQGQVFLFLFNSDTAPIADTPVEALLYNPGS